jgi:hypothetical protein
MPLARALPSAALPSALLAACGQAQEPPPETLAARTGASGDAASSSEAPAVLASSGAPAATAAAAGGETGGGAPEGDHECYFHGAYGLQNSSMVSLRIHGPAEYEAMDERGRYTAGGEALRMETGPLAGRVARLRESSGKPAIVFLRRESEVDGKPTLDVSDSWCYFEPR